MAFAACKIESKGRGVRILRRFSRVKMSCGSFITKWA